jgi:hypothetical protein
MEIFQSRQNVKGLGYPTGQKRSSDSKEEWTYKIDHNPYTIANWIAHLEGKVGLGLIPTRLEDTAFWAAIDIDNYGMSEEDELDLVKRITEYPFTVFRSKSGGFHCYLILMEEVSALELKSVIMVLAGRLGLAGEEIFPKQVTNVKSGNSLSMPFFGETTKLNVQLKENKLTLQGPKEFIDTFSPIDPAEYKALVKDTVAGNTSAECNDTLLEGIPVCLRQILKNGIKDGQKNTILFNIAVYLRRKNGEVRAEELVKYTKFIKEGEIESREMDTLCRTTNGKEYRYQCTNEILQSFCNATQCVKCKYGITPGQGLPNFTGLTKIENLENPLYIFYMDADRELVLTTDQLLKYDLFKKALFEKYSTLIPDIKKDRWEEFLQKYLRDMNHVSPEELGMGDVSFEVLVFETLQNFIANTSTNNKDHALDSDSSYQKDNITYFSIDDFYNDLIRKKIITQATYPKVKLGTLLDNLTYERKKINIGKTRLSVNNRRKHMRVISNEHLLEKLDEQPVLVQGEIS